MGLMQRRKGKAFERKIAALIRSRWPDAVVRRASQADRAHQSDVYLSGGPPVLSRLWLECHDARNPNPIAKLEQADRDVAAHQAFDFVRLPVVVWHRLGSRQINVTTQLWVLLELAEPDNRDRPQTHAVTMALDDFLDLVDQHAAEMAA